MRLPDLLAAVPAAALLLFDRGIINCGLFAQVLLARITFVTRARSTLPWPGRWYGQCTAPATLGTRAPGAVAARTECKPWEVPITIPRSSPPDRAPPTGSSLRKQSTSCQVRQH